MIDTNIRVAHDLLRLASKIMVSYAPPGVRESIKEYKKKQVELKSFLRSVSSEFDKLVESGIAYQIARKCEGEFGGDFKEKPRQMRAMFLVEAKKSSDIALFVDKVTDAHKDAALKAIMIAAFGWDYGKTTVKLVSPKNSKEKILRYAKSKFIGDETTKAKEPLQRAGITQEFIKFFPPSFSIEVSPSGNLLKMFDTFGNEAKTVGVKTKRISIILKHWKELILALNSDLQSSDEKTKLLAIIASIVVYTGIRPSAGGESKGEATDDGEKEVIQTFGATSLQMEHIKFVRNNFVELAFPGIAATENIAELSNADVVSALRKHIEGLIKSGRSSGPVFITASGERITPEMLNTYFRKIIGEHVDATDFRKLRATRVMYDALAAQTDELRQELRKQVTNASNVAKEEIRRRIVSKIVEQLSKAAEKARAALSHDDVSTTLASYSNPLILLEYLSKNGNLNRKIDDIFADEGKSIIIKFDPEDFLASALKGAAISASSKDVSISSGSRLMKLSPKDILRLLDEEQVLY